MAIDLNAFLSGCESYDVETPTASASLESVALELNSITSEVVMTNKELQIGRAKGEEICRMYNALEAYGWNKSFLTLYPASQMKSVFGVTAPAMESLSSDVKAGQEDLDKIKNAAAGAGKWIVEKFKQLIALIGKWLGKAKDFFMGFGPRIKRLKDKIKAGGASALKFSQDKYNALKNKVQELTAKVKEFLAKRKSDKDLADGAATGSADTTAGVGTESFDEASVQEIIKLLDELGDAGKQLTPVMGSLKLRQDVLKKGIAEAQKAAAKGEKYDGANMINAISKEIAEANELLATISSILSDISADIE